MSVTKTLVPPSYTQWILWWHHQHNEWNAMVRREYRNEGEVLEVVFATEWWQRPEYHED